MAGHLYGSSKSTKTFSHFINSVFLLLPQLKELAIIFFFTKCILGLQNTIDPNAAFLIVRLSQHLSKNNKYSWHSERLIYLFIFYPWTHPHENLMSSQIQPGEEISN